MHRMARSLGLATLVTLALAPAAANAQVFGQFTGGSILPMGKNAIGGYVELSSNLIGVMGQVRSSFQEKTDFGFIHQLTTCNLQLTTSIRERCSS